MYGERPSPTSRVVYFKHRIEFVRVTDLRNNGKNRHAFAIMGRPKKFCRHGKYRAEKRKWLNALDQCCEARLERRRASERLRRAAIAGKDERKCKHKIGSDIVDEEFADAAFGRAMEKSNEHRAAPLWIPDRWSACCMVCAEKVPERFDVGIIVVIVDDSCVTVVRDRKFF